MKNHVIIVAGGIGTRMNSTIPKQFLCLAGTPILMRSIAAFRDFDKEMNIILVLPKSQLRAWQKLCEKHSFTEKVTIAEGGDERFQSVKNGLRKIRDNKGFIAIHDAVRPLVTKELIERVFSCAQKHGTAAPYIPSDDSIRMKYFNSIKAFSRDRVYMVQTPQCFQSKMLKDAYDQDFNKKFTDDATVVESNGEEIFLVKGSPLNFKITTRQDLIMAEALLNS